MGHGRLLIANFIGFGFTVYSVAMYLQAFGYVDPSGRLMASGGLALYGGGALGPVIMAQFIPAGDDPSYSAVLIATPSSSSWRRSSHGRTMVSERAAHAARERPRRSRRSRGAS